MEENCFKLPNDAYYSLKVGNRDDLNPKMKKDTARIEIKMKTNLIIKYIEPNKETLEYDYEKIKLVVINYGTNDYKETIVAEQVLRNQN